LICAAVALLTLTSLHFVALVVIKLIVAVVLTAAKVVFPLSDRRERVGLCGGRSWSHLPLARQSGNGMS
jgi:hypothetical protein